MYTLDLNQFNLLIIASVFIGLCFGLLLFFTKRINQSANRYLGLLALVIVFWNIWVLSLDLNIFRYFPYFYLVPVNFSLALGPLLYFYVRKMTDSDWAISFKDLIHFVPLIFELIVHVVLCRSAYSQGILATDTEAFYTLIPVVQLFAIVSILTYSYRALVAIREYHGWLKAHYSNDNRYNLRWLYRLVVIFAALWFMLVPYTAIDYALFDFQLGIRDYYPIYILLSLITIWISIEAFLRPEIVFVEHMSESKEETSEKEIKTTPEIIEKANWLKGEIEKNLFYLDSDLSLKSLAESLDIHPNTLSKVINEGIGKNFSDMINDYRVAAVIDRLSDSQYDHITLLGISFECGFNSKTTFNRVFKNNTGKTPFDFKKDLSS